MKYTVQQADGSSRGAFYIESEGQRVAEMTYSKAGTDCIIIDHTEVSESLRGQGAGKQLLEMAVDYARQHQLKIIPLCRFANAMFQRDPALRDVL